MGDRQTNSLCRERVYLLGYGKGKERGRGKGRREKRREKGSSYLFRREMGRESRLKRRHGICLPWWKVEERLGIGRTCLLKGQGTQVTEKVRKVLTFPSFSYNKKMEVRHGRLRELGWWVLQTSFC